MSTPSSYRQHFAQANVLLPYLGLLQSFLGIEGVKFVSVQAVTADPETFLSNINKTMADHSLDAA